MLVESEVYEAFCFPSAPTFELCNPTSNEPVTIASAASVKDAVFIAEEASRAFAGWSKTGPSERRTLLQRAAALLEQRSEVFVQCMVAETGTSTLWAQFNVWSAIGALTEAAAITTQMGGETIPSDQHGCVAMTVRVPAGVVLGIAPWNAPLLLGIRSVLMPVACGNTAILKASELCPGTHWMIGELFRDAGLPPGVVSVLTHRAKDAPAIVEALIAHPAIRRVNFTGSTKVGRIIGALAGKLLKPVVLELGGKAPLVVLEDADIEQAASAAIFGAFMNHGQICMSTERIVVDEAIADRFAQALATKTAKLSLEGGLVNCAAADRVEALIQDAVSHGAELLVPFHKEGNKITPAVLDRVRPGMMLYGEESFGPVAPIIRVRGIEEAVRVANDTEYGLSASVFGSDIARTLNVAKRIECGVCHINGPTVKSEAQLPFGGVKASGFGKFGGRAVVNEFTELRTITIQTTPQHYPI
ncbi:aldehyde dehydrogenase [Caballeronia sp. 15711]|uniref:aldehyde dehydrogenase n=1 Tax=Caballeronia sp. 15711 TaxID=3391029 RepID=UPI0039E49AE5